MPRSIECDDSPQDVGSLRDSRLTSTMSETNAVTMPENSAETILTETPTVLVCGGGGGIEMGKEIYSLAQREGISERIQMIALDSGSGKSEGLDDDVETISLQMPERRFHDHDVAERPYLQHEHLTMGSEGAIRQPPLGRYYLDNPERIGSHHDQIRRTVDEFVRSFEDDPNIDGPPGVNVFQIVGAGGGTGNGTMPLLTGLLDNVLADLDEEFQAGFEHWAICSLATTSNFDGGGEAPDVNWRYPANSLALLDELRAITGYDNVEYPIRIPLHASKDRQNNRRNAYVIEDNPFSGVFLLRFNQDEANDGTYRDGIGQTAARVVIEWMRKGEDQEQFEGLENEVNNLSDTFMEVRGASFEVPTDRIEELFEAKQKYSAAQETLSALNNDIDELSAATNQVDAALQADTLVRNYPSRHADNDDELPEVIETALERSTQVAGNIAIESAQIDEIEEELGELQDRRTYSFHDKVNGDMVQRTVFLSAVRNEIHSALSTHQFDELLNEFVEQNEDALTEFDPSFDPSADAKDQFLQTVEPMLEYSIEQLSTEIDDMGLTGRLTDREVYTSKKQNLDQTRSRLRELQAALNARDHLEQLADAIDDEYESTVATLESQRESLATTKAETESDQNEAEQRASAAEQSIERHMEAIQNTPLGRFVTLPVASNTELQPDKFGNNDGIASLIEDGILDRDAAVNLIQETLYNHEHGILGPSLETRGESRSPTQGRPIVFCTEATHEMLWANAPSGTDPETIANDEFAKQPKTVFCEEDHSIDILAVYSGLSLDNFDHGSLRESLFEGRATLWGEQIDLKDCYAYPEILPAEHPVSTRNQVKNATLPQGGADNE